MNDGTTQQQVTNYDLHLEAMARDNADTYTTHLAASSDDPVVVLTALRHRYADAGTVSIAARNPIITGWINN